MDDIFFLFIFLLLKNMSEPSDSKRPRNAAPIPFDRHNSISPPYDEFVGSLPTASPSMYSEFNVVLDDGTLQKRTVSLSTLPDDLGEVSGVEDNDEDDEDTADIHDIPNEKFKRTR